MTQPSTPVTVRFSNSTGVPLIPDNDPNANPRGFAIRFNLAEHVHTDIVSHSTDSFPTRTGQEFLEFLKALASSDLSNIPGFAIRRVSGLAPGGGRFCAGSQARSRELRDRGLFCRDCLQVRQRRRA